MKVPAARCGFCKKQLPRPQIQFQTFSSDERHGGRCKCGAAYIVDETGKRGGQTLLDCLALLCDGDLDRALSLNKTDYEEQILAYNVKSHSFMKNRPVKQYIQPRMWFIRLKTKDDSETDS